MEQTKITVAILIVLGLSGCATVSLQTKTQPITWISKFSTPGVKLKFLKQSQSIVDGIPNVTYSLNVTGLPKGKTYALWQKWLDGEIALVGQFHYEDSGDIVAFFGSERSSNQKIPLSKIRFHFNQLFRGEPVSFTLVSTDIDQTIKAFSHFVPFPLKSTGDGGCSLSIELLHVNGRLFGLFGEGFKSNEEVITISRTGNEIQEKKQEVSTEGRLAVIIEPGVVGSTGGVASFKVSGEACEVILNYEWGTAMKLL